jgi:hypothetical protein
VREIAAHLIEPFCVSVPRFMLGSVLSGGVHRYSLRAVLGFLMSPRAARGFVRRGRLAGLRLRATDQDWSAGDGPEVSGPIEALALAATGRPVALDDLAGEGLPILRARPA